MKQMYFTQKGLSGLQEKLHELKTVRRREIADAIHAAKEQGDLSENAEYIDAKEEQSRIEQQIAELEITLKHAVVITRSDSGRVDIGNTVVLDRDGKKRTYRIVGSQEADPLQGMISNESPLGQALLGKKLKEVVIIPTPSGDQTSTIVKIS
jgi:transcription elongation factor GreA